jgi:hypothetical protein
LPDRTRISWISPHLTHLNSYIGMLKQSLFRASFK